jgi:pyrroline-5-carboxylate reductase
MQISDKILFIGSGNMARAIISGMLSSKLTIPQNILCNGRDEQKLIDLSKQFEIVPMPNKQEGLKQADIVFLSVKPQGIAAVLEGIKPFIRKNALFISIIAGKKAEFCENILGDIEIVRVMPNTPVFVLAGTSAISGGKFASKDNIEKVKTIFSSIGQAEIVDEILLDAVSALSGSGPAYVFYLCELLQKAGEKLGLKSEIAKSFAANTIYGAGKMLKEIGQTPEILRKNVTSPNGTTQAAIEYFQSQNLEDIVYKAMQKSVERSIQLS